MKNILIIGSGISGLTCAVKFAERFGIALSHGAFTVRYGSCSESPAICTTETLPCFNAKNEQISEL